ncbi:MAG: sensor histidine kinase [Agrobacterium tumefaciens]
MMWLDRHLILNKSDWGGLFSSKKITGSAYTAITIGFFLLFINDGPSIFGGKFSFISIYTIFIFFMLVLLTFGVFFKRYYILPLAIIAFNIAFVFTNIYQTFGAGLPIKLITVCQTVMYFVINAIVFRLIVVFVLNFAVFFAVLVCVGQSLQMAEGPDASAAQPFMLNAVVLSAACLLLQHLVLTVRGMLIEQLGAIRLQMAALEAEMEIENAKRVAREKAIQLNRISVVEALGASIAHEINQPLAAALTYSRAARNWAAIECQGASETLRAVSGVESNVDRAAKLIDNIRLLTTKKDRAYALADVRDIVRDQVNLAKAEFDRRGIKLLFERAASETTALVCAPEIALATINLLRNAMEAFDDPTEDAVVSVDCRRTEHGWVEVLVIDNGKGLAHEALQKAFGAFQSTKETGAGIGLSICQEVAEHHSGSISLTPNSGRGMTAILRLAGKPDGA